MYLNNKKELKK